MTRNRYTFQYQVIGKDEWYIKPLVWKTYPGARKAADKWLRIMAAERCPVIVRVGKIVNNHFMLIEDYKLLGDYGEKRNEV